MSRRVSVATHERWQQSLAGGAPFDAEDDLLEEAPQPTQRRKESELSRLAAILDELQQKGDGSHDIDP